jgi:predicted nucleotidyltransferase component of viral defense system
MSKSREQSIKQKLKDISQQEKISFNRLLDNLFLERFLSRIAFSTYKEQLIFKGGMCLAQFIDLGRETRDIDFLLTKITSTKETISKAIQEIIAIDVGDDFIFLFQNISQLSLEHKKYPGFRILLEGQLGQIKNKVSIDIGVGDVVRPRYIDVELMKSKISLFEEKISLYSYPPEYIFSEKFEAILHHAELNSRMKDYYDCYRMVIENVLDEKQLGESLRETTSNRGTPLTLIPEDTSAFENLWKGFLKKNKIEDLDLSSAVKVINLKIKMIIK